MNIKTLFIGLLILATILVVGAYFLFIHQKQSGHNMGSLPTDYSITAAELYYEYQTDKKLAARKYDLKILLISGAVDHVEYTGSTTILTFFFESGQDGPEGVYCYLTASRPSKSDPIQIGDYLKIKGLCIGFEDGIVVLEDCIELPENE